MMERIIDGQKKCTKCSEIKTKDCFGADKSFKSGLNSICKRCYNLRQKEYNSKNSERIKEYWIQYREKNKDKAKAYNKKYKQQKMMERGRRPRYRDANGKFISPPKN